MNRPRLARFAFLLSCCVLPRAFILGCSDDPSAGAPGAAAGDAAPGADGAAGGDGGTPILSGPGSLDPSFGQGGILRAPMTLPLSGLTLRATALAPDDGVVFLAVYNDQGTGREGIGKLAANGTIDTAFAGAAPVDFLRRLGFFAGAIGVLPDGRLLVNGSDGDYAKAVRLLANGEPDPAFPEKSLFGNPIDEGSVHGAVLDSDQSWVMEGRISHASGALTSVFLLRLTDTATTFRFGDGGTVGYNRPYEEVTPRLRTSDGRYLCAATVADAKSPFGTVLKIDAAGKIDSTFGADGRAPVPTLLTDQVLPQAADAFLVSGTVRATNRVGVARFLANGMLDTAFGEAGTLSLPVASDGAFVALQGDGKIVIATNVDVGEATGRMRIVVYRYLASGAIDPGFGAGGRVDLPITNATSARAFSVVVQKSGRILVLGSAAGTGDSTSFVAAGVAP
jgi:uncharacterized delta-60 repeat protein